MGTVTVHPLEEWRRIELQIEKCKLQRANFFETLFHFSIFILKSAICNPGCPFVKPSKRFLAS